MGSPVGTIGFTMAHSIDVHNTHVSPNICGAYSFVYLTAVCVCKHTAQVIMRGDATTKALPAIAAAVAITLTRYL